NATFPGCARGRNPGGKPSGVTTGKTRTIQNTLARLGMQASPAQVVAGLAGFGIDVSEGLVRQVKLKTLKAAAQVERQRVKIPKAQRPQVRRPGVKPVKATRPRHRL